MFNLTKNLIQYSRMKHIEIRYHFIKNHDQNSDIVLEFVSTENQLADIFIKLLNKDRFNIIRGELEICDPLQ